jgi:hypothetical protein
MILPRLLNKDRAKNIACAAILVGANDSVVKEINPAQHVPVDEYKENLVAIVDYFKVKRRCEIHMFYVAKQFCRNLEYVRCGHVDLAERVETTETGLPPTSRFFIFRKIINW